MAVAVDLHRMQVLVDQEEALTSQATVQADLLAEETPIAAIADQVVVVLHHQVLLQEEVEMMVRRKRDGNPIGYRNRFKKVPLNIYRDLLFCALGYFFFK